jgi:hypothetical protein
VRIALGDRLSEFGLAGDDGWVNDGVELFDASLMESELCEGGTIQLPVRQYDRIAKVLDDGVVDCVAGLHQLATDRVGLKDVRSMCGEEPRGGGFATAQTAREAHAQHALLLLHDEAAA